MRCNHDTDFSHKQRGQQRKQKTFVLLFCIDLFARIKLTNENAQTSAHKQSRAKFEKKKKKWEEKKNNTEGTKAKERKTKGEKKMKNPA